MAHQFAEIMFTPGVKAAQEDYGSREHNERFSGIAGPNSELSVREKRFIEARDTFILPASTRTAGRTCSIAADREDSSKC